jgi:hypothetical protein
MTERDGSGYGDEGGQRPSGRGAVTERLARQEHGRHEIDLTDEARDEAARRDEADNTVAGPAARPDGDLVGDRESTGAFEPAAPTADPPAATQPGSVSIFDVDERTKQEDQDRTGYEPALANGPAGIATADIAGEQSREADNGPAGSATADVAEDDSREAGDGPAGSAAAGVAEDDSREVGDGPAGSAAAGVAEDDSREVGDGLDGSVAAGVAEDDSRGVGDGLDGTPTGAGMGADTLARPSSPATSGEASPAGPSSPGPLPDAATPGSLLGSLDVGDIRNRFLDIQAGFVDEPRQAVEAAGRFVDDLVQQVIDALQGQRGQLTGATAEGSTEELRLALRAYRQFVDRLLGLAG